MNARLFNAVNLYRCSALIFVLFAAGHTLGFLHFVAPTPEGRDVFARMTSVQFDVDGHAYTYGKFYQGFGLFITASQLFFAYLCWVLSRLARDVRNFPLSLSWTFAALQFVGIVLSLRYFSPPPAVLSAVLTLMLAAADVRVRKERSRLLFREASGAAGETATGLSPHIK